MDFALQGPLTRKRLGRVALDAFATGRDGGEMAERIERAFEHASATLLGAVLDDGDLRARLRSLKKYFLTHQGDFLCTSWTSPAPSWRAPRWTSASSACRACWSSR